MKDRVILPQWLDDLIFEQLGAKYCRSKGNMAVIDWDKSDVLNYLGTYFPRSYTESYCIFEQYFRNESALWKNKEEISLFDFGCGTGGEIFGLLTAIVEHCKSIKRIKILALDGNKYSLRLYENIMELFKTRCSVDICNAVLPIKIEDIYDLSIVETVVDSSFDIIMTFKAICEFVSKKRFEEDNPYIHIAKTFIPKLKNNGMILLVDVTLYSDVSQEWLPKMMDAGLNNVKCNIIYKNEGYNQTFYISHSRMNGDVSKVAWRIIKNI